MSEKAIQALPKAEQQWVSKFATRFLPYGKNMKRWHLQMKALCPHCTCPDEDKDHILQCLAEPAVAQWNKAMGKLDNWLAASNTHPQLQQDILSDIQGWHNNIPSIRTTDRVSAKDIQNSMGRGVILKGCLVRQWQEDQDQYWKVFKSRKLSKHWTTTLITCLLMMAWDMWLHRNKALHESENN